MDISKLPDNKRKILRALVSLDIRNAAEIALDCKVSRPSMVNAISGERGISGDALSRLMKSLGLTDNWMLSGSKVHLWKVGADVQSFIDAVDELIGCSSIWPLTRRLGIDDELPYTGFFVISGRKPQFKHGYPYPPYVLILRDRFMLGRGVRKTVSPEKSKPIVPEIFANSLWGSASRQLYPPDKVDRINMKLRPLFHGDGKITITEIDEILNWNRQTTTSWEQVISAATSQGLSPDDLLQLISRA